MILWMLASVAWGQDFHFTCGTDPQPGCFQTLSEAVAVAGDDDIIGVPGGRYVEDVAVVGKTLEIRLIGTDPAEWRGTLSVRGGATVQLTEQVILGDPALSVSQGSAVSILGGRFSMRDLRGDFGEGGVMEITGGSNLVVQQARGEVPVRLEGPSDWFDDTILANGGLIRASDSDVTLNGVLLSGGKAGSGGNLSMSGGVLQAQDVVFEQGFAGVGMAMHLVGVDARLRDITVRGRPFLPAEERARTLIQVEGGTFDVARAQICWPVDTHLTTAAASGVVSNTVFLGANAAALDLGGGSVEVGNNHFIGLARLGSLQGEHTFRDNLVLEPRAAEGVFSVDASVQVLFNHAERNGTRFADPTFALEEATIAPAGIAVPAVACPEPIRLAPPWTSPLRDGGSSAALDPDGSRLDIGAFGGPEATGWDDADGDDSPRVYDCQPNDPSIHPLAVDVPEDGVDQDCDGADTVISDLALAYCATSPGAPVWWLLPLLVLGRRRPATTSPRGLS